MHDHDIFQKSFDRNRTFPLYISNRLNLASEYISSMPNTHLHYSHNGFKIFSEVTFILHNKYSTHIFMVEISKIHTGEADLILRSKVSLQSID